MSRYTNEKLTNCDFCGCGMLCSEDGKLDCSEAVMYDRLKVFEDLCDDPTKLAADLAELEAYRKTGLKPDDVENLAYLRNRYEDETYDFCGEYGTEDCPVKAELEEYRAAEKAGSIVRLPCKVEDKVYTVYYDAEYPEEAMVEETEVVDISLRSVWIDHRCFDIADIGKTIFLTREAAQAELEGNG